MSFAPIAPALIVAGLLAAGAGVLNTSHPPGQPAHPAAVERRSAAVRAPGASPPEELVVPPESVLGLQLETPVTQPGPGLEEPVYARVTRDVMVGSRVAVPAGSRAVGWAWVLEKGGTHNEPGGIELVFTSLELPGGDRVEIATEPVARDAGSQAAPLPGARPGTAGGAVVGALLGGRRAQQAPQALVMGSERTNAVELRAGTVLSVRTQSEFRVKVQARR